MRTPVLGILAAALVCFAAPMLVNAGLYSQADDTRVAAPEEQESSDKIHLAMHLGGSWLDGNVENEMLSAGISLGMLPNEHNELFLNADGIYSDFNGTVVLDKQTLSMLYAYKALPHWNAFFYSTHARNRFLELDYRTTQAAGLCHHGFVSSLDKSLISLAILDEREWWDDDSQEDALRAVLSINATKKISGHAAVALKGDYMPSLTDSDDYRLYGEAYIELKVTEERLSFRLTFSQEYDSQPREGIEETDTSIIPSLVYGFSM